MQIMRETITVDGAAEGSSSAGADTIAPTQDDGADAGSGGVMTGGPPSEDDMRRSATGADTEAAAPESNGVADGGSTQGDTAGSAAQTEIVDESAVRTESGSITSKPKTYQA
jgi:hypothetical protein